MQEAPAASGQSVLWLNPRAWEDDLEVRALHQPIPLETGLEIIATGEMEIVTVPYETLIAGQADSPWTGGHVLAVEDPDTGRHFFAVPAPALPLLAHLLPAQDYHHLVWQTPLLAGT